MTKMSATIVLCLFLCAFATKISCGNILIASDMLSPSHKLWNFALAEGLLKKGHNVTMIAMDNMKHMGKEYNNYHELYFEASVDNSAPEQFNITEILSKSVISNMFWFYDYSIQMCDDALKSEGLQKLLDYPDDFKFDAILFDLTTSSCLLPLMKRFNYPPSIAITAFLLPHYLSQQFGNDIYPAYLPSYLVDYPTDMSFLQRSLHYVCINIDLLMRKYYLKPTVEKLIQKRLGNDMDSVSDLEDRLSLLLCNLEPVFHHPQPLTPNIITVGGLHIKPPKKLPKDLQTVLDNAKSGAILFALGTNMRSDGLGPERIKILLEAFSEIKQIVLWKFESNLTEYQVPQNVIIRKWLPQNEILAHPNTKVFFSHAGGLSTLEAAYHGVPILGMPFIVDQYQNLRLMEEKKLARALDYGSLTTKNILENIHEMLDNPSYLKAAKEVSTRMRDQPQTPLEKAVYWVEYAIRHNGTHFFDTRSRTMSLFVSTSLDVELLLLAVVLVLLLSIVQCIKLAKTCLRQKVKDKKE